MIDTLMDIKEKELPPSEWIRIDQQRINQFADLTDDHQYIHVDPVRAANTAFGSTIAHGLLTLSIATPLVLPALEAITKGKTLINYGSNKVRFLAPVACNADIRAHAKVIDVVEKSATRALLTIACSVEIKDHPQPALSAELLLLILEGETA